jgi:hypothetical protein
LFENKSSVAQHPLSSVGISCKCVGFFKSTSNKM